MTEPVLSPTTAATAPSTMRIGVCLAVFGDRLLRDALAAVAALGYALIDLPTDRRFGLHADACDTPTAVARTVREFGIDVASTSNSTDCRMLLGPYGGFTDAGFTGTDDAKRAYAIAEAQRAIDVAAATGASHARLFLGCPDVARWLTWAGTDLTWRSNVVAFVERCRPLVRYAQARGVRLLFEAHPKQVAYDLESLCQLWIAMDGELDICLDPANLLALGHDPVDVARGLPTVPVQVQAKDVERAGAATGPGWVRYGPQPPVRFRCAGWGEVPWRELFSALAERGFRGPVMVEHEDLLCRPEDGLDQARQFLDPLTRLSSGHGRTW